MPSAKEKMLAGEYYDASDPELVAEREQARTLTRLFDDTGAGEREIRREILDELLGSSGENLTVEPPFHCDYGDNISLGDDCYVNVGCVFLDVCPIQIGSNCLFGPGVHLYTATHPLEPATRREGLEYGEPVTVGDDVWIGGRAIVNPGVTIGDNAVVGSGAVLTRDVPDGVVVAGNPAEVVRRVGDERRV